MTHFGVTTSSVRAINAWTSDKSRCLAGHQVALEYLDAARARAVEALVDVHRDARGGDVERSLAAVPAGRSTRESLARFADAEIAASLGRVGAAGSRGVVGGFFGLISGSDSVFAFMFVDHCVYGVEARQSVR